MPHWVVNKPIRWLKMCRMKLLYCFRFYYEKLAQTLFTDRRPLVIIVLAVAILYFLGGLVLSALILAGVFYYLYSLCDMILYCPHNPSDSRINVASPKEFGLEFENIFVYTRDQIRIHLQFIKRSGGKNCITVVYFHGNSGNIGHRLENVIELHDRLDANILLVEYRGYGHSAGKPSEYGLYLDALAALRYLGTRNDIDLSRIVLFGRSLGGAVVIGVAHLIENSSHIGCPRPQALIVENTFTSVPDIARHILSNRFNLASAFLRILPNCFYKSRFNSSRKISHIKTPILFICGLSDELIPAPMMIELHKRSNASYKEWQPFESGTHNFTWQCPDYYSIIDRFLKRVADPSVCAPECKQDHKTLELEEGVENCPISETEKQKLLEDKIAENNSLEEPLTASVFSKLNSLVNLGTQYSNQNDLIEI